MPDSLAAQRWARIHEATHCTTDAELTLALNLDPIHLELAKAYGVLPLPWLTRLLCTHGINPAWIMTGAGDPYITETFQPLRHAALLTEDGQDHRRQEMAFAICWNIRHFSNPTRSSTRPQGAPLRPRASPTWAIWRLIWAYRRKRPRRPGGTSACPCIGCSGLWTVAYRLTGYVKGGGRAVWPKLLLKAFS